MAEQHLPRHTHAHVCGLGKVINDKGVCIATDSVAVVRSAAQTLGQRCHRVHALKMAALTHAQAELGAGDRLHTCRSFSVPLALYARRVLGLLPCSQLLMVVVPVMGPTTQRISRDGRRDALNIPPLQLGASICMLHAALEHLHLSQSNFIHE